MTLVKKNWKDMLLDQEPNILIKEKTLLNTSVD